MVTLAKTTAAWDRASYLENENPRQPQAIGDLMQQLLARYSATAKIEVVSMAESDQSCGSNHVLGSTL